MTQLPSVSELLVGAHMPLKSGVKIGPQASATPRNNPEASPRHTEHHTVSAAMHSSSHNPRVMARSPVSFPSYIHHSDASRLNVSNGSSPAYSQHINVGHAAADTISSGRTSISSVDGEHHAFSPASGIPSVPSMDYIHYRDMHSGRHMSLSSQHSSPMLHSGNRKGSLSSSHDPLTRATSYQSMVSNDNEKHGPSSPVGERHMSVSYPTHGRISFSQAPVSTPNYNVVAYAHAIPFHNGSVVSCPPPAPTQVSPRLHYTGRTAAGSGPSPNTEVAQEPLVRVPQIFHGPTPGPHGPIYARVSPGSVNQGRYDYFSAGPAVPGQANNPHVQFKQNVAADEPRLQNEQKPSSGNGDPNHALINKRCIIKRRTRTGCLTCRKRRIKCDERKPHCFNCERSRKLCLGYEALTSNKRGQESKKMHRSTVHDLL